MTEAEALETIGIYTANAHTAFTLYLSFTFAYFASAHFVGRDLSRFQVFAATGLYVVSAISGLLAAVANVQVWGAVASETRTVMDSLPLFDSRVWVLFLSTTMVMGIFLSLYYMWDVRHPKAERRL